MQIAPMHHGIGVAKPRAKPLVQRNRGDFAAIQRIHQPQTIDINRHRTGGVAHAQIIKGVKGIGPQLNARPDFPQLGRFFQNQAANATLGQADSGRQPTNTTASNQNTGHRVSLSLFNTHTYH